MSNLAGAAPHQIGHYVRVSGPNDGVHGLEVQLQTSANPVGHWSMVQRRQLVPRIASEGEELRFAWRLRRNRDFRPAASLLPYGLAVAGGELVDASALDGEDFGDEAFPFMSDPVRQVDGQTKYPSRPFFVPNVHSWDVVDGVLWTAFDLPVVAGPFSVVEKAQPGEFKIACTRCGWRGRGRRSVRAMLHRLLGDVARHDCSPPE